MKRVLHRDFLIVRYILSLKNRGVPPFLSSLMFGSIFLVFAILFYNLQATPVSFGCLSSLFWLSVGPFLIYRAGQMSDQLWPDMLNILDEKKIEELQAFEKKFHSYGYLFVATPVTIITLVVSAHAVTLSQNLFEPVSLAYAIFYITSWGVLALVGSIGIWGTFQLISLILAIRKYDLELNPLSHDRFGGMEFLADFGIKGTIMYSSGALLIPHMMEYATENKLFQEVAPFAIGFSVFFAFTVLLSFLVQVFALNRAAVKGKNKILKKTGDQYKKLLREYEEDKDPDLGVHILVIQGLFDETYQMRVYPFDVGILLKLAGSIVLPIILGTIEFWFPWIPMH